MGNLFGKSRSKIRKEAKVTSTDRAVLQIKQQRDKVKQYQKRLNNQIKNESELIRKLVQQDQKQKALLLLKKKKYTEKVLDKLDNELMTIENLIMDIEYKNVEQNVLKGIEVGNEALKQLNAVFSIEKIETLLDETQEGIEKQREITQLISGFKEGESDDADLEGELDEILNEDKIELPDVPADKVAEDEREEAEAEPEPQEEKRQKEKPQKEKKILVEAQ